VTKSSIKGVPFLLLD